MDRVRQGEASAFEVVRWVYGDRDMLLPRLKTFQAFILSCQAFVSGQEDEEEAAILEGDLLIT